MHAESGFLFFVFFTDVSPLPLQSYLVHSRCTMKIYWMNECILSPRASVQLCTQLQRTGEWRKTESFSSLWDTEGWREEGRAVKDTRLLCSGHQAWARRPAGWGLGALPCLVSASQILNFILSFVLFLLSGSTHLFQYFIQSCPQSTWDSNSDSLCFVFLTFLASSEISFLESPSQSLDLPAASGPSAAPRSWVKWGLFHSLLIFSSTMDPKAH